MKHFLLLSIVLKICILASAQNNCDSLQLWIDGELSDSILVDTIYACYDKENIILNIEYGTNPEEYTYQWAGANTSNTSQLSIRVSGNYTAYVTLGGALICTKTFNVQLNTSFTYKDQDGIEFSPDSNSLIRLCSDKQFIKAIHTTVDDSLTFQYVWLRAENDTISKEASLDLSNITLNANGRIYFIAQNRNCAVFKDTLKVNIISPPKFENDEFTINKAESCSSNFYGSIEFKSVFNSLYTISYVLDGSNLYSNIDSFGVRYGEHQLIIAYDEIPSCKLDTVFNIGSSKEIELKLDTFSNTLCEGDILKLKLINDLSATNRNSIQIYNDSLGFLLNDLNIVDSLLEISTQSMSEKLRFRIQVLDSTNTCTSKLTDSVFINPIPSPQITPNLKGSTLCQSEATVFTTENQDFTDYIWYLNGDSINNVDSLIFNPSQLEFNTYSVIVTDSIGCEGMVEDSVYVVQGIDLVYPNIIDDNICKGSKILYQYNRNLNFESNPSENNQYQNNNLKLVEWNTNGSFLDQTNSSDCNKVDVSLTENTAPNGKIQPFGTSSTLVFSDSDISANHLDYQWFFINIIEGAESIYNELNNANERIIDCNDFDCLFAFSNENEGKVLGLEIYDQRNGCTNLIFYDKLGLFPGLKEIPVGLAAIEFNQSFNLYPNINDGSFIVQIAASLQYDYNIAIFNAHGKMVHLDQLSNKRIQQINIPNIEAGIYFAILKQENRDVARQKFIIH